MVGNRTIAFGAWALAAATVVVAAEPPRGDRQAKLLSLQQAVDGAPTNPVHWLALASEYERLGQENEALRAFTRALPKPEAHEACARLKQCDDQNAASEHLAAAIRGWEAAKNLPAADRCRRAFIMTSDNRGAAAGFLADLLRREPPDPPTLRTAGELFVRAGRPRDIVPRLEQLARQWPAEGGIQTALDVDTLRRPDRVDDVVRQLIAALNDAGEQPTSADARLRARCILLALASEPKLIPSALNAAVRQSPSRRQGGQFSASWLALRLAGMSDYDDGVISFLRSRQSGRGAGDPASLQALLLALEQRGSYAEAAQLCVDALQNSPRQSRELLYRQWAMALKHLGHEKDARAAADQAVQSFSDSGRIADLLTRIDVLDWFGRLDEAKAQARSLLEEVQKPEDERRVRTHLAALAAHRQDLARAEGHLRRALELAPGDPGLHNDLGYYLAEANRDLAEAERLCRFAVDKGRPPIDEYDPGGEDPAYRDSLGWVYFRQGRLIAAQAEFERALALPGGRLDANIWDHLGDVLAARGKMAEARAAWTEALARPARLKRFQGDTRVEGIRKKL